MAISPTSGSFWDSDSFQITSKRTDCYYIGRSETSRDGFVCRKHKNCCPCESCAFYLDKYAVNRFIRGKIREFVEEHINEIRNS